MAFDFKGTFTASQFERYESYLLGQTELAEARIQHLEAERERIGNLLFAFDTDGVPTGVAHDGSVTYCGKLFAVYEALGGDAFFDLQVRSSSQAVFRQRADETRNSQLMSNGEVIGTKGMADAESGELIDATRELVQGDIDFRKTSLERKIRRAIDYSEQLAQEIGSLQAMTLDQSVDGSMAFLIEGVKLLFADRGYKALVDDGAQPDPHGKLVRAPFAGYNPGPEGSEGDQIQRTPDGVSLPQTVTEDNP